MPSTTPGNRHLPLCSQLLYYIVDLGVFENKNNHLDTCRKSNFETVFLFPDEKPVVTRNHLEKIVLK